MDEVQNTTEQWKFVAGWEAYYRVSCFGRVYSVYSDSCLKPKINKYGYPVICLRVGERLEHVAIHTLVCRAFHGPKPTPFHVVHHLDGVKTNAAVNNLAWVTPAQNSRHAFDTGLMPNISVFHGNNGTGSANLGAKLTADQVRHIRLIPGAISDREISIIYGVSSTTIFHARRGNRYKDVHS